jgi:enolase-phosphatase E1
MTKLFLFDIEGTTTDINFVHQVLFPYAEKNLDKYITNHQKDKATADAIQEVQATVYKEEGRIPDFSEVLSVLHRWIKEDRKHAALKELQGHIWDLGYSKNDFKGHVYPDVKPFFNKILELGSQIGIYSSGSVHAQKLIFGYSVDGDLTPLISYYFDTRIGDKKKRTSYTNIANAVHLSPEEIHFFSDMPDELEAAAQAGFRVTHVMRLETKSSQFEGIMDFSQATNYIG